MTARFRVLLVGLFVLPFGFASWDAGEARADIYKYKKKDGSVVYTDNLAQLPSKERAHYNKIKEAREKARRAEEKRLGPTEYKRRQAEAKRKELLRRKMSDEERAHRLQAIDEQIEMFHKKEARENAKKKLWRDRMKNAKAQLRQLISEFKKVQGQYKKLATKADFTLLPGQNKEKIQLKKVLDKLEVDIDKQIVLVEQTIPTEARKAAVPPGWIRVD